MNVRRCQLTELSRKVAIAMVHPACMDLEQKLGSENLFGAYWNHFNGAKTGGKCGKWMP